MALLVLFGCVLVAGQADGAILYAHENDSGSGGLYTIDTVAQTVTLVGAEASRDSSGPDIQFNSLGTTIYMSQSQSGAGGETMLLIDPSTGLNTGTLSLSSFPASPSGGTTNTATALEMVGSTLYASFHVSGPESGDGVLGTIDTSSGAITAIGQMTGMDRPTGGLHFVDGTMYAVSATGNNDSRLFTIDLATGAGTLVGNMTLNGEQQEAATALAFADGKMYTLLTNNPVDTNLYSIDLGTAEVTLEFDLGRPFNSLTVIPEPGTLALAGTLIISLAPICAGRPQIPDRHRRP